MEARADEHGTQEQEEDEDEEEVDKEEGCSEKCYIQCYRDKANKLFQSEGCQAVPARPSGRWALGKVERWEVNVR